MADFLEQSLCVLHNDVGAFLSRRAFYRSSSPKFKTGVMPFCKECMHRYISFDEEGNRTTDDEQQTKFIELCRIADIYFDPELYERASQTDNLLGSYFRELALAQYRGLTYEDYDSLLKPEDFVVLDGDRHIEVSDEQKYMWGANRDVWEYEFLDERYYGIVNQYKDSMGEEPDSEAKYAFKTYALLELRQYTTLLHGEEATASELGRLHKNAQEQLSAHGMTYEQIQKREDTGDESLGKMIATIEKEEPIPDWEKELGNEDKLRVYIEALRYSIMRSIGQETEVDSEVQEFLKQSSVTSGNK